MTANDEIPTCGNPRCGMQPLAINRRFAQYRWNRMMFKKESARDFSGD
ncbi:MAG TPA: hypothetical protein VHB49_13645 [Bradyrhizobium sp.]|nr:hypothetical protein [Bradyrhizobium sp.]